MAEDKRDWLSLCNETKIPFQDFMAGWCARCFQAECSRSLHGKSKFDVRAANWEDRLFNQVSKLDPGDERFKEIVAKRFLPIAPGQLGQAPSAWMDPRDIEPTREISLPEPPEIVLPPLPVVVVVREELPVKVEETPPPPAPAPPPAAPPAEPVIRNTAAKPRQMIGGVEAKPAQPVLDPWAPKQPLRPDDTLVQPGARIKLPR